MSFWSDLSTPIKGVTVVGAILAVVAGLYVGGVFDSDEVTQQRGLPAAGAAP